MPAWTNEVSVTVSLEELDVASASLSASKATVEPGESVDFTISYQLNRPFNSNYDYGKVVKADIYVNGEKQSTVTVDAPQNGQQSGSGGFTLSFSQPGTYTVKAYVYVASTGYTPSGYQPEQRTTGAMGLGAWTNEVTVLASAGAPSGGGAAESLIDLILAHKKEAAIAAGALVLLALLLRKK